MVDAERSRVVVLAAEVALVEGRGQLGTCLGGEDESVEEWAGTVDAPLRLDGGAAGEGEQRPPAGEDRGGDGAGLQEPAGVVCRNR